MANNFYAALFNDGSVKTYPTWELCSREVTGAKECLYKGFKTRQERDSWLYRLTSIGHGDEDTTVPKVYVDGSFGHSSPKAGWAWVCIHDDQILGEGNGTTPWDALSRNIDGECMAVMEALQWAKSRELRVMIIHDYLGLSAWAYGEWKADSEIAQRYCRVVRPLVSDLHILFRHIRGHQGNKWNEYVDSKAKEVRQAAAEESV